MAEIGIGDAVEVRFISKETLNEEWLPATVVAVENRSISVAFSDGERLTVQTGYGLWRRPGGKPC